MKKRTLNLIALLLFTFCAIWANSSLYAGSKIRNMESFLDFLEVYTSKDENFSKGYAIKSINLCYPDRKGKPKRIEVYLLDLSCTLHSIEFEFESLNKISEKKEKHGESLKIESFTAADLRKILNAFDKYLSKTYPDIRAYSRIFESKYISDISKSENKLNMFMSGSFNWNYDDIILGGGYEFEYDIMEKNFKKIKFFK